MIKVLFVCHGRGKWTTCNSGINGAKWGNKSDDSAMKLPADYF